MKSFSFLYATAACFSLIFGLCPSSQAETLEGAAAYGDWRLDAPGLRRKITPADLPPPLASPSTASGVEIAQKPSGASPKLPEGFKLTVFAEGLKSPRRIAFAPNGDVFVVESEGGAIRAFRPDASGAKPKESAIFAQGLNRPYGLAFYPPGRAPKYLYVATTAQVLRYAYSPGALEAEGPPETIVNDLPAGAGHWTRDIAFSPDGKRLYVAVGSKTNVAESFAVPTAEETAEREARYGLGAAPGPEKRRADVLVFDPDGRNEKTFATGLRNCSGLTFRPGAEELWCAVNERDMLGDDLPPDYATRVLEGGFYGWPWYYIGANEDPRHKGERPDLASKIAVPNVLIQPHSAPLGIAFYEGAQFPASYKGSAFVALHGSWNRAKRTGYKVVRLLFRDGKPTGEYEDFLTGLVIDDDQVYARPVCVAEAPDGALFVCEDAHGVMARVTYEGK